MKKKNKPPFRTDYCMSDITFSDSVSTNDFTGLIPSTPEKEDDMKNYEEIKTFYPDLRSEKEI